MNFGSKYVYYYHNQSDEEDVSADSDSDCDSFDGQPALASAGFGRSIKSGFSKLGKAMKLSGRNHSPEGEFLQHDGFPAARPNIHTVGPQANRQKRTKKVRKADPNVFTISVGDYVSAQDARVGLKTLTCQDCKGVLPSFSKFEAKEGTNNWRCEFCSHVNRNVNVEGWTKPPSDDITYELEPPITISSKEKSLRESHNVIFAIDISGSMGCTIESDRVDATGRRVRSFLSRLDAIKRAAEHQIRQIKEESPNVGVGLITFGTEVAVYGDGTQEVTTLGRDEMNSQERLKAAASDFPPLKPISETFNILTRKLMMLEIRGSTALGPGLLSSISLAANVKGSKVIICTDGCANTGFGSLPDERCQDEDVISESRSVYRSFGEYAKDLSVTVSVISLEGTDCRLVHLGLVAQITGGVVDIVDPVNMNSQFGNILASKTLATDVTASVILHHSLYIRDLRTTEQNSTKVEQLGNVTDETEMVVEFGVKAPANENEQPMTINDEDNEVAGLDEVDEETEAGAAKTATGASEVKESNAPAEEKEMNIPIEVKETNVASDETQATSDGAGAQATSDGAGAQATSESVGVQATSDGAGVQATSDGARAEVSAQSDAVDTPLPVSEQHPSELPFQVQIEFTTREGGKYRRVITNLRECTDKREAAESEMNMNIVGAATTNTVSNVALTGNYQAAKGAIATRKRMTERYVEMSSDSQPRSAQVDVQDYMQDLDDLDGLVSRQAKTTKARIEAQRRHDEEGARFTSDCAMPSRPRVSHLQAAGSIQTAGMSSAKQGSDVYTNLISDDLANEYYARSKSKSYQQKMNMKHAGKK